MGLQAFNESAFVTSEQTAEDVSGQIIATSHEFSPQMVVKSKGNLLFQGKLDW